MVKCIVPLCKSRRGMKSEIKISFHEIPADFNLRRKWIAAIEHLLKHVDESWELGERALFCSLHFPDTAYKNTTKHKTLIRGSIPSIFPIDVQISSSGDDRTNVPPSKNIDYKKTEEALHVILKENVNNQQKTNIPEDTASNDSDCASNTLSKENVNNQQKTYIPEENEADAAPDDSVCAPHAVLKENVNNQQETYIPKNAASNDSVCVNVSANSVCIQNSLPLSPCKTRGKTPIKFQSALRSIRRLKARIRKLEAEGEHLKAENSSLKDKLIKYNINHLDDETKMENPKFIFLKDQLHALSRKKMRWSDSSLEYATELYFEFPYTYQFLKEKLLTLPSHSTIERRLLMNTFSQACSDATLISNIDASPASNSDASPPSN